MLLQEGKVLELNRVWHTSLPLKPGALEHLPTEQNKLPTGTYSSQRNI